MFTLAKRAKNLTVRKLFPYFEKYLGIHVTPVHYFSPIPTTFELSSEVFTKTFTCRGIDWNEAQQIETLRLVAKYNSEFTPVENSGLSLLDAQVLYSMIREAKPKSMIEISSGDTTEIALQALRKNRLEGNDFKFTAIEPYPNAKLQKLNDPDFQLLVSKLQDVKLSLFSGVDLLFIDSTHVSRIDSDVNYEIFEIIPVLPVGALIHWHDIPLPMNYWKDWIQNGNQFWNESYVLHAFLMYNKDFGIQWGSNYMKLKFLSQLKSSFPYFKDEHRISSFWVKKLKTTQQ